jgi:hypothetical protein
MPQSKQRAMQSVGHESLQARMQQLRLELMLPQP